MNGLRDGFPAHAKETQHAQLRIEHPLVPFHSGLGTAWHRSVCGWRFGVSAPWQSRPVFALLARPLHLQGVNTCV